MKKGSVILFALFMILFVVTIVAILYLANKRYLMIAKEERENYNAITDYQSKNFSLYIVNAFAYNNGVINATYNVNSIYKHNIIQHDLYKLRADLINRKIYNYISDGLLRSRIYKNDDLYADLKIFEYNVWNLYKYEPPEYKETPKSIREIFEQKGLTSAEKKVLVDYKDILIGYIKETFDIPQEKLNIVAKYNYEEQIRLAGSIYQSSIRKVKIAINFAVGGTGYVLFSDFYIKTDMKQIQVKDYYKDL
ncbi:MAG: hypothetical protein RMJ36_02235 [Candidatus Calescibacterium sp.]|nr:hypothetical protein [Candidatus Calescibacterium sp.]MDW8132457.1 hypothetical protein [Candidatus Calescibacterium sp.]